MRPPGNEDLTKWDTRRVGLELEYSLCQQDGTQITHAQIHSLWETFGKYGWQISRDYHFGVALGVSKTFPNGKTYRLDNDASIGCFEMSMPPCTNLQEAEEELRQVQEEALQYIADCGLRMLSFGVFPGTILNPIAYRTKKSVYATPGFDDLVFHRVGVGTNADQCGVSVKIGEMVRHVNNLNKLSGFAVALFANSGISDGKIFPWKEMRAFQFELYALTDTGSADFSSIFGNAKREFSSVADMLHYMWETVPYGFLSYLRDGKWVTPVEKVTYADYLRGSSWDAKDLGGNSLELVPQVEDINLAMLASWNNAKPHIVLDSSKASVEDFLQHYDADTLEGYLENRLTNCYIEFRAGAESPKHQELTVPAFIVGLVNNPDAFEKILGQFSFAECRTLFSQSLQQGMQSSIKGVGVQKILTELVDVAAEGLRKRDFGEEKYLDILRMRISDGKCPNDYAVGTYNAEGYEGFLKSITL